MDDQTDVVHLVDVLLQERKFIEKVWDRQVHIPPKRAKTNNDKKAFLEYLAHTEMRVCRLREKEEKLDQRIYELYQLTPEQIQMIEREMGNAICLYPRVSVDELRKDISCETFQRQYCDAAQTLFQMAVRYRTHPESLLELRKEYGIFRKKDLRRVLSM
jgi:hypothetical protein